MGKKVLATLTVAIGLVVGAIAGTEIGSISAFWFVVGGIAVAYLGATSSSKGSTTYSELRDDPSSSSSSRPPSGVEEDAYEALILDLKAQVRTLQEAHVASANIR
ncbi:unnamed protein product [Sphagnum balticum]